MSFNKCVVLTFEKSADYPKFDIYSREAEAIYFNEHTDKDYLKIFFIGQDGGIFISSVMQDKACIRNGMYMNTFERYNLSIVNESFVMCDVYREEEDITIPIENINDVKRRLGL